MVISIARQSVILKCEQRKSVLLGNYEFYYAAGLLTKLYGINLDSAMKPQEMHGAIMGARSGIAPKDEKEQYLIHMVEFYEPLADYDAQMVELFAGGAAESDLWQVHTRRGCS